MYIYVCETVRASQLTRLSMGATWCPRSERCDPSMAQWAQIIMPSVWQTYSIARPCSLHRRWLQQTHRHTVIDRHRDRGRDGNTWPLIVWRRLLPRGYSYKASCAMQTRLNRHLQFLTSGHSDAQPWAPDRVPGCQNYKRRLNPVCMAQDAL